MNETTVGALFIVSTPIGNLEDITLRALRVLKEADIVAAEDTRRTLNLLRHFEISSELVSCHAFNEHRKVTEIIGKIKGGKNVAFVSDAGTPGISDPGYLMVREAIKEGIEPIVIPGPSALTFAACASGFPIDSFTFLGFPPVKKGRREQFMKKIAERGETVIIYESPYRMAKLLTEIAESSGGDTIVAVIREATKLHEEILRGPVSEIIEKMSGRVWKGECAVVISR
ncbi:MAG: 16S rRNA (cytidine(1402)-2'-O)-methyltransferase [Lentisphaerae bacterium GWF2_45_14]|nr:MAG: 16S rRNA (cytidine(1402)-2'-O)-methyltransferase [Lentisphaerae bacterium GWF2_45_14]